MIRDAAEADPPAGKRPAEATPTRDARLRQAFYGDPEDPRSDG